MRALVQRVVWAEVEVEGKIVGKIGSGLLVYQAVGVGDTEAQAAQLAQKVANLRIFEDGQEKLNLSVRDIRGGVLAIPNFTLLADASRGRRPEFSPAAPASEAEPIYEAFVEGLRQAGCRPEQGLFGAHMHIQSQADGPVNVMIGI